jgi:putative phage-type endonuclease
MTFTGRIVEGLDPADRPVWLDWRRTRVGGSDVSAILGISNYGSPWSVWAEKVGLIGDEPSDELMEAGRWLEHAIAPWFSDRTGLHVIGTQAVVEAADDPVASCTVDGFVAEAPGSMVADSLGELEIKTRGFGKRWDPIPADVQAQCQWQMYVTGHQRAWIAVLMGRRLDIHDLERDESDIAFIVDRVHRFWTEHVVTGTPPATDGHDATLRAIAEVYPTHTPDKSVELDDLADVLDEWRAAKAQRLTVEKREKEAKAAIVAALEDAEEGTVGGERVVSYRTQTRAEYVVAENSFRVLRETKPKKKENTAA